MFTEKDYGSYCLQIITLENKMETIYKDICGQLQRNEFKVIFEKLAQEEAEHAGKVRELLTILTNKDAAN